MFLIAVVVALIIKKPPNSEDENQNHEQAIIDRHARQQTGEKMVNIGVPIVLCFMKILYGNRNFCSAKVFLISLKILLFCL